MTTDLIHQLIPAYFWFNVFIFGVILYTQIASNAARDWPSVPGKVMESRVVSNYSMRGLPRVSYTYEVDGKTYRSLDVSPGGFVTGGSFTQEVLARFPKGADVTVYYNPKNPAKAVLEKKSLAQADLWKWFLLGNLFMPLIVLAGNWFMSR